MAKKMTLEELARMVQQGFNETATKADIHRLDAKVDETREVLARAIKDLELRLVANVSHQREEIDRLKAWMESIEERLTTIEGRRRKSF